MKTQFELKHRVPLPLEHVQSILADLQAFGNLHPLMERVENLGHPHYLIHEFKPLLFGIKARFKYPATVQVNAAETSIVYEAKSMGMANVIRFQLRQGSDLFQTQVTETVSIQRE